MRLLFWNLRGNAVGDLIEECLTERRIDIAVFAEHGGVDLPALARDLGDRYPYAEEQAFAGRTAVMASNAVRIRQKWDCDLRSRYSMFAIGYRGRDYILCGIHLHDRWTRPDSAVRLAAIRRCVSDIEIYEEERRHDRTIVIGDFNAGPFDTELLQMDAFNAALFKDVILRGDVRIRDGVRYRRFYDPILHFLSEEEDRKTYGSYYHDSDPVWHCLDQVLVRRSLAESVSDLRYLRRIGTTDLISKVRPDPKISDHLPLYVRLDL